jgi:hypothetical protein
MNIGRQIVRGSTGEEQIARVESCSERRLAKLFLLERCEQDTTCYQGGEKNKCSGWQ